MTADLLILHTPYSIKAFVGDQLRAQATFTGFDSWHVPLRRRPVPRSVCLYCGSFHPVEGRDELAWRAVESRAEAVALVSRLAVGAG
jgi:hypothetical protein